MTKTTIAVFGLILSLISTCLAEDRRENTIKGETTAIPNDREVPMDLDYITESASGMPSHTPEVSEYERTNGVIAKTSSASILGLTNSAQRELPDGEAKEGGFEDTSLSRSEELQEDQEDKEEVVENEDEEKGGGPKYGE